MLNGPGEDPREQRNQRGENCDCENSPAKTEWGGQKDRDEGRSPNVKRLGWENKSKSEVLKGSGRKIEGEHSP